MTFTADMKAELGKPLNPKHVKPPAPGKYGEYIEGWRVIDEANRIFGFDGWTRETVEMVETNRELKGDKYYVGYRAKVRVTAQGVIREGSAGGSGVSKSLSDAIESALKEAETDAMKRALMTFGNPFGLALYDKSKANVGNDGEITQPGTITDDQRSELTAMAQAAGVTIQAICETYNISSLPELPAAKFDRAMKSLRAAADRKKEPVTA